MIHVLQLKKIGRKYKEEALTITQEFDKYKTEHAGQDQEIQNTQQANIEKIQSLEQQVKVWKVDFFQANILKHSVC